MMHCGRCNNPLNECTCPDIDERMRELTGPGSHLLAKWCLNCDKHYARCRCAEPLFGVRTDGKTSPAIFKEAT